MQPEPEPQSVTRASRTGSGRERSGRATFSVVLPNFNHARYLESAIRAHLDQTRPPDELIVIDDGSTDDSCAIVERLAAETEAVRLIRLPENRGTLRAVNRGLAETRATFVCLAAADDLVTPAFGERTLAALERHPGAAYAFSDPAELLGDTGRTRSIPLSLSDQPRFFDPDDYERLMRRNFFTVSANTVIYRRAPLEAFGGLREDLDWMVEWLTLNGLALRHGACYVPGALAYLRVSPDSYSARKAHDQAGRKTLFLKGLEILHQPELADLLPRFRRAGLPPEMSLRALGWLLGPARRYRFLTGQLATRLLLRGAWGVLRPATPNAARRMLRRLAAAVRR